MSESLNPLLERNCELAGRHRGERCFILATGPSIKKQNLKPLKNEICFGLSNFFVHPDFNLINPKYYCLAGFCPPHTNEGWDSWMEEASATTKNCSVFIPIQDRERNLSNGRFSNRPVYSLNLQGTDQGLYQCDLTGPVSSPWSIPVMALQIAIYMEFKEIYLLGCDHDWILHLHRSTHFYEENQHAAVRAGVDEWKDAPAEGYMEGQCRHLLSLWGQYRILKETAKNRGIEIFNATEGGILDVFQQVRLEATLAQINNQRLGVI